MNVNVSGRYAVTGGCMLFRIKASHLCVKSTGV